MLTQERYKNILDILSEREAATVGELAQLIGVSESTVRRDLNALDGEGRLRKVYGGATALNKIEGALEDEVNVRDMMMSAEKEIIAEYAATLINNDDFIYIDSGTTTMHMMPYLEDKHNITIVTASIHVINIAAASAKFNLQHRIRLVLRFRLHNPIVKKAASYLLQILH